MNAALGHVLATGGSWTVSGTSSDGHAYVLALGFAPLAPAPFPVTGATAARSQQTMNTTVDGVDLGSGSETFYFDATSLAFTGIAVDDGSCSVMTASPPVPATATVGGSGALFAEDDHGDCVSGSAVLGTTTATWSLESDAGITLLCWNLVTPSPPQSPTATVSYCVQIGTDGTLGSKARVNLVYLTGGGPVSLTARNF